MTTKQRFAIMQKYKKQWLEQRPDLKNTSGIYCLVREENGFKFCYIGQSVKVVDRLCSHMLGYQHIDISLKKRGLYSESNPEGWRIDQIVYCPQEKLDAGEQYFIRLYADKGYQIRYNKEAGGRTDKVGFEKEQTNGYYKGLKQGENKALKQVGVYFDKYLDYVIKEPTNKVKQRKYEEFKDLLKGGCADDTGTEGA